MNELFEKELFKKYPLLYIDKDEPMSESLMCFGFDSCPNEWYIELDHLSQALEILIQDFIEQNPNKKHPRAFQVKSKFGYLRFYMHNNLTPLMQKIISTYEKRISNLEDNKDKE